MSSLWIDNSHRIPDHELQMQASRSSGPGGQGVNTTDSQVELRWYVDASGAFTRQEKQRIRARLGNRITKDGVLIIRSSEQRSQHRNREDARERLATLLADALKVQKRRRRTRPTRGSQRRRLAAKRQRGETKRLRQSPEIPPGT